MRIILKTVAVIMSFAAVSLAIAPPTTQLTVTALDSNGNPLQNVAIAAVNYGMNGPSTNTVADITNASGQVLLTLNDNMGYNLHFSSQGYSPTIRDQFNNPDPSVQRFFWPNGTPLTSTVTLTALSGEEAKVGRIVLPYTNATANNVLFGSVNNMALMEPGQFGITKANGAGSGTLIIDNVPIAAGNTYSANAYDPLKNRGINRNVGSALTLNATITLVSADFNQSAPPPKVATGGGNTVSAGASAKVTGVVRSTGTGSAWNPIARLGVNFRSCQGGAWANVDENGHFELSNLTIGGTYYAEVMGGCTWSQSGPGACYEPYRSPAAATNDYCTTVPGANDFVYVSSTADSQLLQGPAHTAVDMISITLSEMPKSSGQIRVYVKASNGAPIPNANVNVSPDGSPWPKSTGTICLTSDYFDYESKPGFANSNVNTSATGYALIDGLPTGNYTISVWTPFSNNSNGPTSFNSGPDGQFGFGNNNMGGGGNNWMQMHCTGYGVDDYRVYVDTDPAHNMVQVFNSSNTSLSISSITYIVTTGGNSTGKVKGTVTFPEVVDMRDNPIMITLYPQCGMGGCTGVGNFASINSSGSTHYDYDILVASGASYYMNIRASGWGRVRMNGGNDSLNFSSTDTITVDMKFARAGTITGTLYKPDGSVYAPATNEYLNINANNNNGWASAQLQKDGTFEMRDVLPGVNQLNVYSGGNMTTFNYALPEQPSVTVVAGSTSTINLNLIDANYVGIKLNMANTPDQRIVADGWDQLVGFKVIPLPAGSVLNSKIITTMLTKGSDATLQFRYSKALTPGQEGPCGSNWSPAGFCAVNMPSPSLYDLYLMRSGDFGGKSGGTPLMTDMPYPHFTVLSSSKNVVIDSAHVVTYSAGDASSMTCRAGNMSGVKPCIPIDLTPTPALVGNATLSGSVSAANFFRPNDYEASGGDFNKFVEFLPVLALYDADGVFKAAGIVLPSPAFIAQKDATGAFEKSFAAGYAQFKALLDEAGSFGYELRSLRPSTCYTAVMTTPNYPSYQSQVCLGVDKSTTALNVNLDTAVGAGATVTGYVKTAVSSSAIEGAAVELIGGGIDTRSMVTDSSGVYKFEGLPAGEVKVRVSANGYALAAKNIEIAASGTYSDTHYLVSAPGSITGTVYAQKMPFKKAQPGALIYAYDDTYNGLNSGEALPLIKTITGADGTYKIPGVVLNHVYKVFLKVPGKYTLNISVTGTGGEVSGQDFTMLPKPLDIELFARQSASAYEFTILNPQDFKTGNAYYSESPFTGVAIATVTLNKLSSGQLFGTIPLSALTSGKTYVLHGEATSYSNKQVIRELLFGLGLKGNSKQNIDDIIIGDDSEDASGRKGNEALMDESGADPSGIVIPVGAMLPISTAAIPSCSFSGTDKNDSSVSGKVAAADGALAGNLYDISVSSVSLNPDKGIEITLAYDKSTANLTDLGVAQYNNTTAKWETVNAVATVNPVKGTVKVKLKNLASVLALKKNGARPSFSTFNGREYVAKPQAATATLGTFAVVRPSVAGTWTVGAKVRVFNVPNPFNLKNKSVVTTSAGTLTTDGTIIHVEVPAANVGDGHVRIYTLAGELVRDLKPTFTSGHNYVVWDGRNKGGKQVANGVYYGIVELPGKSPDRKDATFKMAVIK